MIEVPSYHPRSEESPHLRRVPSIPILPTQSSHSEGGPLLSRNNSTSPESEARSTFDTLRPTLPHDSLQAVRPTAARGNAFPKNGADESKSPITAITAVPDVSGRSHRVAGDNVVQQTENLEAHNFMNGHRSLPVQELKQDAHTNGNETHKRRQSQADIRRASEQPKEKVLKLSSAQIHELTSSPESIPTRVLPRSEPFGRREEPDDVKGNATPSMHVRSQTITEGNGEHVTFDWDNELVDSPAPKTASLHPSPAMNGGLSKDSIAPSSVKLRPSYLSRTLSTPSMRRRDENQGRNNAKKVPPPLNFVHDRSPGKSNGREMPLPSPMPSSIPLPPISLSTYLQLELSSNRPSPLYIHRSRTSEFPYESSKVKLERLQNFLFLGYHLEQVLWFGTLACLDSWLYSFTILPLRFAKAVWVLIQWLAMNAAQEACFVASFVWKGSGRMWQRRRQGSISTIVAVGDKSEPNRRPSISQSKLLDSSEGIQKGSEKSSTKTRADNVRPARNWRKHRRSKSVPSLLLPGDKADLLKGLLIIFTSLILMRLDASRMYHWIRMQAAIKLYVIYNVLEVGDRLLSAIGQDILECLFSKEALERKADGRSKVLRPFWLFLLALAYSTLHATGLFYQVITLNVAVNSYSNALITLLMSNQFVEIKSTVFKKFEKENLFQLTCADVVERFQLWIMLTVIASRNLVETGVFNIGFPPLGTSNTNPTNTSDATSSQATPPRSATSILPQSFMIIPSLFSSLTAYAPSVGQVLGPFLVVLGSEMVVDWLKHCYITKFNNTKPRMYNRFLDILAKDYYVNAFADQNLTKRLGLPVIPLSCLFIRAGVQTYHMLMAAWSPPPIPSSATSLSSVHDFYTVASSEPTTTAMALHQKVDYWLHQVPISLDNSITYSNLTTVLVFLLGYFVLLAVKLVLGMVLLSFSRSRYRSMKEREDTSTDLVEGGKRVGGWGVVEVDEEKRRVIYEDDPDGLRALKERETRDRVRSKAGNMDLEGVNRYEMAAKRIW